MFAVPAGSKVFIQPLPDPNILWGIPPPPNSPRAQDAGVPGMDGKGRRVLWGWSLYLIQASVVTGPG